MKTQVCTLCKVPIAKKRLKVRLLIIFFMVSALQLNAKGTAQTITLSVENTTLANVFRAIRKQTGYQFFYDDALLKDAKKVSSLNVKNAKIRDVLNICFKGRPLVYEIIEKTIVVKEKSIDKETILTSNIYTTITGTVKDSAGNPLESAIVKVKNTSKAVPTDANGFFSIDATPGDVLIVSLVGYNDTEIKVTNENSLTIILHAQPKEVEQVVVTALGIKRSEKALPYNVQEFKNDEITRNKDANFVNALTGKVAGVTINSSSSGIGGATRVVMRGTKSISGNNNTLYVIDGIPMPNPNGGTGSTGAFQGVVTGEGISSINPDDIESISALTGPAAAALYGSQGANGVIIVNTKKGIVGKMGISLSHSTDFFSPFVMPKFQNTYGQSDPLQMQSWGTKLINPSTYKAKDFFQTGNNVFNSVSISGGSEKSQTFFSAGSNNAWGIIPKNTYNRYNVNLRHSVNFTDRLSIDFNAMYIKSDYNNMIAQGQYHNPLLGVYLFPPGDDFEKYKVYQRYDPDRKIPVQFWPYGNQGLQIENPYWITNAESNKDKSDRYMLSVATKYKLLHWLDLAGRVRLDNSNINGEVKRPASTDGLFASKFGFYTLGKTNIRSTYSDVIASIHKSITSEIDFRSNIGMSILHENSDILTSGGNLSLLANFYSISNTNSLPTQTFGPIVAHEEQAIFATAEFDYHKWLYLNLTGRQEWSSALAGAEKKSYFYPSAGISAIFSDALKIPKNIISFGKARFSFAEVGNAPLPGITSLTIPLVDGGADNYSPAPFPTFQAERTRSYEAGLDLKFFKNKLSFIATIYKSNTYNQLMDYKSKSTLYTDYYYNAGNIENKGIEASLGYNFHLNDLIWSSTAIFSMNRNKVKKLSQGYINPATGEVFGNDSVRNGTVGEDLLNILAVGGSMADLYITQVLREDNQGELWVDPSSGAISKVNIPARYIGRTTPNYNIGWRNNVKYKDFDLAFLVDARFGGIGVSYTQSIMDFYGTSQKSAEDRDNGGVMIYGKKYANVQNFYNTIGGASGAQVGMAAYYVYSATNVRLRELSFGYTIPTQLFNNKIKNVRVAFTGRNLFMFYNKSPFDPESTSSTGTYYQGIDYFRQPSYRSFGFSLSAQF